MQGHHEWKPIHEYQGSHTEPGTGRTYQTRLHDVRCSQCHRVVTLPSCLLPEELEGCLGTAARPPQKTNDFVDYEKDGEYALDQGAGKVRRIRG